MKILDLLSYSSFISVALAIGQQSTINFNGTGLCLAKDGSGVQIWAEQSDWPAVLRAADDLAMDFGRVTGTNGSVNLFRNGKATLNSSMISNITGITGYGMKTDGLAGGAIIAGTIGSSTIIDRLIRAKKVDISRIEGTWEAYVSTVVSNPVPGVPQALVIAGKIAVSLMLLLSYANKQQDPIAEVPSTAFTLFQSRSASRHGTTGPTQQHRSTVPSMLSPQPPPRSHLRLNTAGFSSTTRPLLSLAMSMQSSHPRRGDLVITRTSTTQSSSFCFGSGPIISGQRSGTACSTSTIHVPRLS